MHSDSRTFKNAAYAHLAEVGKALSNATRLEILELLAQGPRTVDVLAGEVGHSVANTSHHLQALKRAQLVRGERNGQYVEYSVVGDEVAVLLASLHEVAGRHVAALEKLTRGFFAGRDELEAVDQNTLLARLRDDDAVLLDVRPEHEFAAAHLPGAVSMPMAELESRLSELPKGRMVVAYCRGPFCTFSADAARVLRENGFEARRTTATVGSIGAAG